MTTERIVVRTPSEVTQRVSTSQNSTTRFQTSGRGPSGPRGTQGKSAYEVALDEGFVGSASEWLQSINGSSAYQVALDNGFVGTEQEWISSLAGLPVTAEDIGKILTNDGNVVLWEVLTKAMVGLANVDNTSDMDKPVSHAIQAALNEKLGIEDFRDKLEEEINNTQNVLIMDHGEIV